MRITLQPGFILHYRPYRETSLLLDVLTEEHGRIALISRGIRKNHSPLKALLQPFNPLLLSWQGKTELMTLTTAEMNGLPFRLQGDNLLSGFYLNELLIRLLQKQDSSPKLYTVYRNTLLELQTQQLSQRALRLFEKKLLAELGYSVSLEIDFSNGEKIAAEQFYQFYPEQGFKLHKNDNPASETMIFRGKALLALAKEELNDLENLRDAKRLMRILLAPLLGPQPLHSRKLFTRG